MKLTGKKILTVLFVLFVLCANPADAGKTGGLKPLLSNAKKTAKFNVSHMERRGDLYRALLLPRPIKTVVYINDARIEEQAEGIMLGTVPRLEHRLIRVLIEKAGSELEYRIAPAGQYEYTVSAVDEVTVDGKQYYQLPLEFWPVVVGNVDFDINLTLTRTVVLGKGPSAQTRTVRSEKVLHFVLISEQEAGPSEELVADPTVSDSSGSAAGTGPVDQGEDDDDQGEDDDGAVPDSYDSGDDEVVTGTCPAENLDQATGLLWTMNN
ncbi:MAG: hypothetical protein HQM16_18255, partial [Deltaproteobacteria bacterium]|nr:hypothetical protein [Deltaproteobacteria bacterium]